MKTNWKKANEVVCEVLGEGALLVDAKTGQRWLLNTAATALWILDATAGSVSEFCALINSGAVSQYAGGEPTVKELGPGGGPRRRPSPRGNSGPG